MSRYGPGLVLAAALLAACTDSTASRAPAGELPSVVAAPPASAAERRPGESAGSFAARHPPGPGDALEHAAEVALPGGASAVAAFYMRPESLLPEGSPPEMAAYLFVPTRRGGYTRVLIDTIGQEGGPPRLEHVFLANADRDPAPELLLIASWLAIHHHVYATLYGVQAYDAPDPRDLPRRLTPVELGDELRFQCDCEWRDGRREKARYKTPGAVKAALAQASR